jgi:hypothetical protein
MKKFVLVYFVCSFLSVLSGIAQNIDTIVVNRDPHYKNVIKLNPTPMMLWHKKNVTFSYERVVNPKQSFTVGLGYLVFNNLLDDTLLNNITNTTREKSGLNFSFEYRFYMNKRNSRTIPDGLYLAPFFSCYLYQFKNGLDLVDSPEEDFAELSGGFYALNFGGALGYQFVLWKRMTIDLIMIGPAVSYYGGKVQIKGEIDLSEIKEINEELYNKIKEKYPMAENVLVDKTFEQKGKVDVLSVGYRYLFQIGFLF